MVIDLSADRSLNSPLVFAVPSAKLASRSCPIPPTRGTRKASPGQRRSSRTSEWWRLAQALPRIA
jgi:hypothetical protein